MNVTIPLEKVNAMLEHLINVPIPYRYSEPLIQALREAVEGAKTPPLKSDTE